MSPKTCTHCQIVQCISIDSAHLYAAFQPADAPYQGAKSDFNPVHSPKKLRSGIVCTRDSTTHVATGWLGDDHNCRTCGNACDSATGEECVSGGCVVNAKKLSACTLGTAINCASCGDSCASGEECTGGACLCGGAVCLGSCESGVCLDTCSLGTDYDCSACGDSCKISAGSHCDPSTKTCTAPTCTVGTNEHCGACGQSCMTSSTGQTCYNDGSYYVCGCTDAQGNSIGRAFKNFFSRFNSNYEFRQHMGQCQLWTMWQRMLYWI